jgi:hypothetical protein
MLYENSSDRDIKHVEHWFRFCSGSFSFYCYKALRTLFFVMTSSSILLLIVTFTIDTPLWNPHPYYKPDFLFYYSLGLPLYGFLLYQTHDKLKDDLGPLLNNIKEILSIIEKDFKENKFNKKARNQEQMLSFHLPAKMQDSLNHIGLEELYNNCIRLILSNKKWEHLISNHKLYIIT